MEITGIIPFLSIRISAVRSVNGIAMGAAKALKAMMRERMVIRVPLNILKNNRG